jgi:NAD(P)-dependent dehydrogenase (short-subunit alcohol dehydrogenase family)
MPKSVFISGASSGIGKALSLELVQNGYQVFAGVRNPADADTLHSMASPQLIPVMLDITDPSMVTSACLEVSERADGILDYLINNAGISLSAPMEFIPIQDFRQQLEVNLIGQLALTQACLPMLTKSTGRILFISSVAGRLVTPFNGPYAISKAALVAMADALRLELAPWKILVSVLIVGSVQTPIWEKSARTAGEILRRSPTEAWKKYGQAQKRAGNFYHQTGTRGMNADRFAHIVRRHLEKPYLKPYILIGMDAVEIELMAKLLPVRWRDWLVKRQMGLLSLKIKE